VDALTGLDVQRVALMRGERLVVRDASFRVAAGETLSIEGRNGAGKTSILRALAGFLEPRHGDILFRTAGGSTVQNSEERGRYAGWMGHQDAIKNQFTAREHLRFHLRLNRCDGDIDRALARFGLARLGDIAAQYLSAGQKRRLALARLVLVERPLWLLDEPLSALDRDGKSLVRDVIGEHCARGGIAVAATHEPLGVAGATFEVS
jgi:heme exporter protein A